ncbi:cytoplasmic protein [Deltaproteobacteria bacterium]|nr:cytoplasmic protein [Deltaproteobacteria bacterium]
MTNGQQQELNFTVDKANLYREEAVTDMKVASIRRMVPMKEDGTDDPSRESIFVGQTQVMTPEGAMPIQSLLKATTLTEAIDKFPEAMQAELQNMVKRMQEMQQQQQQMQKKEEARIIVP